jgi:hypothetical protein
VQLQLLNFKNNNKGRLGANISWGQRQKRENGTKQNKGSPAA